MVPLSSQKEAQELNRKVALECSKRCLYSLVDLENDKFKGEAPEGPTRLLNYAEQNCLSRCTSKFMLAKETADKKILEQVELPPLTFA